MAVSVVGITQLPFAKNQMTHVYSYGIFDKNTSEFICKLLQDTTTLIIMDYEGNFELNDVLLGFSVDSEIEECMNPLRSKLRSCYESGRLIGFNMTRTRRIPHTYLKGLDGHKYERLAKKYPLENNKILENPTLLQQFCSDVVTSYSFSDLDSLLLYRTAFDRNITIEDFRSIGIIDRKFVYIHDILETQLSSMENSAYLFIAKKGSKANGNYLWFKNKIDNKLTDFQILNKDIVPDKIKIKRQLKYSKKEVRHLNFIAINELSNCMW